MLWRKIFLPCSIRKDSIRSTNVWHQLHQEVELSSDMFAECLLLAIAVCVNLALLGGTIKSIPFLFLPWMLVYGFEVMGGWAVTLAFLLLPGNSNSYMLLKPNRPQVQWYQIENQQSPVYVVSSNFLRFPMDVESALTTLPLESYLPYLRGFKLGTVRSCT